MKPTGRLFHGQVKGGRIVLNDTTSWNNLVVGLEGHAIEIRLGKRRQGRSLYQNAYYWSVVVAIFAEHCGYEPEEIHDALKWRFLRIHTDEQLETVRSTSSLDTAQFTEYIEQCRRLAAEMGVVIPDPHEVAA